MTNMFHPKIKGMLANTMHKFIRFGLTCLDRYQILNFMLVGAIGFCINLGLYYPLTLVFKSNVEFLGQHFYLPPFVISSLAGICSNYQLNKAWTFRRMKAKSFALTRYLSMAVGTLMVDLVYLWLLVDYGGLPPIAGAAVALNVAFVMRYLIARTWVWGKGEARE